MPVGSLWIALWPWTTDRETSTWWRWSHWPHLHPNSHPHNRHPSATPSSALPQEWLSASLLRPMPPPPPLGFPSALPEGKLVGSFSGHASIVNALALNADDVLVSGGDDGTLKFWDYSTGYAFQDIQSRVQPGSLDAEAGIYAMAFDQTGG